MAATKYQVLYRYTNPNSNQFITNDVESKYNSVLEFYHDEHKIAVGLDDEVLDANNEKSELIINGNNTANDNYNMLFKLAGTKIINKKVWLPESTGYVIRDKEAIKDLTSRAVDGDYSGDYLLMEGDTIENGVVVAKKNITSNITVIQDESLAANKDYYTSDEVKTLLEEATIYKLKSLEDLASYKDGNNYVNLTKTWSHGDYIYSNPVYTGPVFIDEKPGKKSGNNATSERCVTNKDNACTKVRITPQHIETYTIPAHYEESADYPYVICDTYDRVEQSPWFILSTHGSLTSALEKTKAIVKSVGIENVKLIKVVPTEQFIKIN